MTQLDPLVIQVAKRFIQRRDVYAIQTSEGGYMPAREGRDGPFYPLGVQQVQQHLAGTSTYGHYLLDSDDMCRVFAFDIDLEKNGTATSIPPHFFGRWAQSPDMATWTSTDDEAWWKAHVIHEFDARESWKDRSHPSRPFVKKQMRELAQMLTRGVTQTLGIPTVAAYTGAKGCHVYGFTGPLPAADVREAAQLVIDNLDTFVAHRGKHFYKHASDDPIDGFPNFTIEIFPKQVSVGDGGFGNLMRLPLGRNKKNPADPTFFLDLRAPMSELKPHPDPVALLESGNPWAD